MLPARIWNPSCPGCSAVLPAQVPSRLKCVPVSDCWPATKKNQKAVCSPHRPRRSAHECPNHLLARAHAVVRLPVSFHLFSLSVQKLPDVPQYVGTPQGQQIRLRMLSDLALCVCHRPRLPCNIPTTSLPSFLLAALTLHAVYN